MLKKKKNKNKNKNNELWVVTYIFVALMLAVICNVVYFLYFESENIINNSYNSRQELLAKKNIRGSILSDDGKPLAQTVKDEDGKEERYYPYENLFSHVVGYSTKGKTGIEYLANMTLLTSNASIGEKIQNEIASEKNIGDSVRTTLNIDLQKTAYTCLGNYDGAVIVSDPKTGKILAMVSKPDFNPNEINEIWDEVCNDVDSSVLLNRSTQGLYPPGSTFKILTSLVYYRQNQGDVSNYHYNCNGYFEKNGDRINCYHKIAHGSEDFMHSFEKSCNASFANIGLSLDIDRWKKTCNDLKFNEPLDLEFVTSKSSFTLENNASDYDIMQTSIGQGKTQITPIQLNMITSAIANNGISMTPYLIEQIENYNGGIVKSSNPTKYATLMSKDEAEFLKELMTSVVENGTASKLKGLSYTAAGKTGSAEYNTDKNDSHAWFTGFAPADNPEICVTIIVEGAGSGGEYAVPIAKKIFDEYFK